LIVLFPKYPDQPRLPVHPTRPLTTVMCAIEIFRRDRAVIVDSIGTFLNCSDMPFTSPLNGRIFGIQPDSLNLYFKLNPIEKVTAVSFLNAGWWGNKEIETVERG